MEVTSRLPDPSADEIALSARLGAIIRAECAAAGGFLPFERFMELALYAPGLGYYVAGATKFGRDGDFVTAPELSPLFGATLAAQCVAAFAAGGIGIIEFGGGSGRLAASLMSQLITQGIHEFRYAIVELSPELRARQHATIAAADPSLLAHVEWWQGPPDKPWRGAVIANEILDALPVTRFEIDAEGIRECGVHVRGDGSFAWVTRPATISLVQQIKAALPVKFNPTQCVRAEINRRQALWLDDLHRFLEQGLVLIADYGDPRDEYYQRERLDGTLQCYYRHRVHHDALWWPGLQDITAAVDFSALADAAVASGFEVAGFATQTHFLMSCGIGELLAELPAADQPRAAQALKILMLPQEMGTRLKFMTLTKAYAGTVRGYELKNERHRL